MTGDVPPGRLIGRGRAADVYELGGDRVLRRYRTQDSDSPGVRLADIVAREARLMEYLRSAGFPVPQVYDADGSDLVMDRVYGVDLLTDLARRPWRARGHGATLAAMHDLLHEVRAPDWLDRPLGDGDGDLRVMHMDLHPGNVMLTAAGPVVIDWSNGCACPAGADVAMATIIMAISEVDELPAPVRLVAGLVRGAVIAAFERAVSADPAPYLTEVAGHRLADRNVRPSEAEILRKMIAGSGS